MILVSVIVPVYNEEKYIHSCVNSILNQDFIEEHKDKIEIIFIDGNSQDKTKSILNNYKRKYSFIQILDNMHKHVQRGLNIGIHQATGEYIVRLDAHAEYAPDYISMCIQTIKATHAQNVGGPMVASHKFYFQKIIAAAYNSKFAFGGAVNYNKNYEGYVDTVFLGCFKRKYLLKLGIYDENMNCNEDDELNFRILLNKNKIYMTPKIKSIYYPRSNLKSLFVQFFRYGFWKIFIIRKHKKIERFTQTIPGIFFIFCATLPIILFSNFTMKLLYISVIFLYFMLNLYFCFSNKYLTKIKDKFLLFFVHFTIHIAYGSGFFSGIFMLKKNEI
ncbi:MAG: glycosyltransferase [Candidatus Improbicoccus devescovinae]|nr:MAG: glycosyltransferase [Candidatus Improbicoccus devescovinae]